MFVTDFEQDSGGRFLSIQDGILGVVARVDALEQKPNNVILDLLQTQLSQYRNSVLSLLESSNQTGNTGVVDHCNALVSVIDATLEKINRLHQKIDPELSPEEWVNSEHGLVVENNHVKQMEQARTNLVLLISAINTDADTQVLEDAIEEFKEKITNVRMFVLNDSGELKTFSNSRYLASLIESINIKRAEKLLAVAQDRLREKVDQKTDSGVKECVNQHPELEILTKEEPSLAIEDGGSGVDPSESCLLVAKTISTLHEALSTLSVDRLVGEYFFKQISRLEKVFSDSMNREMLAYSKWRVFHSDQKEQPNLYSFFEEYKKPINKPTALQQLLDLNNALSKIWSADHKRVVSDAVLHRLDFGGKIIFPPPVGELTESYDVWFYENVVLPTERKSRQCMEFTDAHTVATLVVRDIDQVGFKDPKDSLRRRGVYGLVNGGWVRYSRKDLEQFHQVVSLGKQNYIRSDVYVDELVKLVENALTKLTHLVELSRQPSSMTDDELADACKVERVNPFAWEDGRKETNDYKRYLIFEYRDRLLFSEDERNQDTYLRLKRNQVLVQLSLITDKLQNKSSKASSDPTELLSMLDSALLTKLDFMRVSTAHPKYGQGCRDIMRALQQLPALRGWPELKSVPGKPWLKRDGDATYEAFCLDSPTNGGRTKVRSTIVRLITEDPDRYGFQGIESRELEQVIELLSNAYATFNLIDSTLMEMMLTTETRAHNQTSKTPSTPAYSNPLAKAMHEKYRYSNPENPWQKFLVFVDRGFIETRMGKREQLGSAERQDSVHELLHTQKLLLAYIDAIYPKEWVQASMPSPDFAEALLFPGTESLVTPFDEDLVEILGEVYDYQGQKVAFFEKEPQRVDSSSQLVIPGRILKVYLYDDKDQRVEIAHFDEKENQYIFSDTSINPGYLDKTKIRLLKPIHTHYGDVWERTINPNQLVQPYDQYFDTALPAWMKVVEMHLSSWPQNITAQQLIEKGGEGDKSGLIATYLSLWGQVKMWPGRQMWYGLEPLVTDAVFMLFNNYVESNGKGRRATFIKAFEQIYSIGKTGGLSGSKEQIFTVLKRMCRLELSPISRLASHLLEHGITESDLMILINEDRNDEKKRKQYKDILYRAIELIREYLKMNEKKVPNDCNEEMHEALLCTSEVSRRQKRHEYADFFYRDKAKYDGKMPFLMKKTKIVPPESSPGGEGKWYATDPYLREWHGIFWGTHVIPPINTLPVKRFAEIGYAATASQEKDSSSE